MKWFGQHLGMFGGLGRRMQSDRGKARDEHDFERRLDFGGAFGEFDPVHAGHDDVRQQKIEADELQGLVGLRAVPARGHGVTGAFQRRRQEAPKRIIVFRKKNFGHEPCRTVSVASL